VYRGTRRQALLTANIELKMPFPSLVFSERHLDAGKAILLLVSGQKSSEIPSYLATYVCGMPFQLVGLLTQ
jgi:hypothetical protein